MWVPGAAFAVDGVAGDIGDAFRHCAEIVQKDKERREFRFFRVRSR
jgi:hypothetical protein